MQNIKDEVSFSEDEHLIAKPDLKRRAIPEWRTMMIFEPDGPRLCVLNPVSWLLLEICDGRALSEIEDHFVQLFGNRLTRAEAKAKLYAGLRLLFQFGLLTRPAIGRSVRANLQMATAG